MAAIPSGADALANTLLTNLTAGKDFAIPDVDLSDDLFKQPPLTGALHDPIDKITIDDLTTGVVDGTGVFDKLMTSLVAHLKVEYAANRISGAEYTKAYVGVVGAALATAQQFLLAKDQAYWGSLLVQQQALASQVAVIEARVSMETARVSLVKMQYEAVTAEVVYGLTKMKISTEDAAYAGQVAQKLGVEAQTAGVIYTNANILPVQKITIDRTNSNLASQGEGIDFTNDNILPQQEKLLKEQVEVQRAQTLDTRSDGATITGSVGKQKELYGQQIISYQWDGKTKVAKLFTDSWITQKTIDEGLLAPDQFTNVNINEVLVSLRDEVDMGS